MQPPVTFKDPHEAMIYAFLLAKKADHRVHPNPFVGAVVVKEGQMIGSGFHVYYGGPHAECVALDQAKDLSQGSDLMVTLEPCSTFGKTPPCTDKIIKSGIKHVYIGCLDPNPNHYQQSLVLLQNAGIQVTVLDHVKQNQTINAAFYKFWRGDSSLPYIQIKVAISMDGYLCDSKGQSKAISQKKAHGYVHELRSKSNGILIGANTLNCDNPKLTVRGIEGVKDPCKIILSRSGTLDVNSQLLNQTTEGLVYVFTQSAIIKTLAKSIQNPNVKYEPLINNLSFIKPVFKRLRELGIYNVLIEGGGKIIASCLKEQLVDECHLIISPKLFGHGLKSIPWTGFDSLYQINDPATFQIHHQFNLDPDICLNYRIPYG